ncbi:MAG: thiamine-phosphate kinase [Candidatus Eisenbacteria bacterium]|nr:thiamine-phosphate kinase [Candidatus Eisenbacteria bacterium]
MGTRKCTLAQLGEFGLIDLLARTLGGPGFERGPAAGRRRAHGVPGRARGKTGTPREARGGGGASPVRIGIGDDAAVLRVPAGSDLVFTTDSLFEGVHFRLDWATPEEIGWKALAASASDLAAMGARPLACVVALGAPRGSRVERLLELYRGMRRAAKAMGLPVTGGDTSRADCLALSVSAVGVVPRGRAVPRDGGRPRDVIYVTGSLGDSALGLELLRRASAKRGGVRTLRQSSDRHVQHLLRRHFRPEPRLAAAARVMGLRPTSMIDVSDGLSSELGHLERAAGVCAHIDTDSLPLGSSLCAVSERLGLDPIHFALGGGEDYELLFTIPPAMPRRGALRSLVPGVPLNAIGYLGRASRGSSGRGDSGSSSRTAGFDHFR